MLISEPIPEVVRLGSWPGMNPSQLYRTVAPMDMQVLLGRRTLALVDGLESLTHVDKDIDS